jgi:ATP-binding cassette subfamily B multidrug efflux pump
MDKNKKNNVFDFKIFYRLMGFAKKYRVHFVVSCFTAVSLALIAALRPYLIIETVDSYIKGKNPEGLLTFSMLILIVLISEVLLHLTFIYIANWLGQHIIKDIRVKLFEHVLKFKMSYFDKSSVGQMVTRVVSDVETIAQFFGQGLFMIISDLLKMVVIACFMQQRFFKLLLRLLFNKLERKLPI